MTVYIYFLLNEMAYFFTFELSKILIYSLCFVPQGLRIKDVSVHTSRTETVFSVDEMVNDLLIDNLICGDKTDQSQGSALLRVFYLSCGGN